MKWFAAFVLLAVIAATSVYFSHNMDDGACQLLKRVKHPTAGLMLHCMLHK